MFRSDEEESGAGLVEFGFMIIILTILDSTNMILKAIEECLLLIHSIFIEGFCDKIKLYCLYRNLSGA